MNAKASRQQDKTGKGCTTPLAAGDRIVHPELGTGVVRRLRRGGRALPLDLDLDGISGESPVNHDPVPGEGWDEGSKALQKALFMFTLTFSHGESIGGTGVPPVQAQAKACGYIFVS